MSRSTMCASEGLERIPTKGSGSNLNFSSKRSCRKVCRHLQLYSLPWLTHWCVPWLLRTSLLIAELEYLIAKSDMCVFCYTLRMPFVCTYTYIHLYTYNYMHSHCKSRMPGLMSIGTPFHKSDMLFAHVLLYDIAQSHMTCEWPWGGLVSFCTLLLEFKCVYLNLIRPCPLSPSSCLVGKV